MKYQAVTFDCWSTLLYEREPLVAHRKRIAAVLEISRTLDPRVDEERVGRAYDAAWAIHFENWNAGAASGAAEIAGWTLEHLSIHDRGAIDELTQAIAEAGLETEIGVLEGGRELLERLESAGCRRALICDTGLNPGSVVRQLLSRAGLLDLLEVHVFSDETGAPKPDPQMFLSALGPLNVAPQHALHVGDLLRTDVAGARQVGMHTARIRHHYDDSSELLEADHVVDSFHDLWDLVQ